MKLEDKLKEATSFKVPNELDSKFLDELSTKEPKKSPFTLKWALGFSFVVALLVVNINYQNQNLNGEFVESYIEFIDDVEPVDQDEFEFLVAEY